MIIAIISHMSNSLTFDVYTTQDWSRRQWLLIERERRYNYNEYNRKVRGRLKRIGEGRKELEQLMEQNQILIGIFLFEFFLPCRLDQSKKENCLRVGEQDKVTAHNLVAKLTFKNEYSSLPFTDPRRVRTCCVYNKKETSTHYIVCSIDYLTCF